MTLKSLAISAAFIATAVAAPIADVAAQDGYLGEIRIFAFPYCPQDWSLANGAILAISDNRPLFALLGTTYGGDGRVNFALPNLQGRMPIGFGALAGTDTTYDLGDRGGTTTQQLTVSQLAPHSHAATSSISVSIPASTQLGDTQTPGTSVVPAAANAGNGPTRLNVDGYTDASSSDTSLPVNANGTVTVEDTGSGAPFSIQNPYLALTICIATSGPFPPRS